MRMTGDAEHDEYEAEQEENRKKNSVLNDLEIRHAEMKADCPWLLDGKFCGGISSLYSGAIGCDAKVCAPFYFLIHTR